jgi:transposase InsO family protein
MCDILNNETIENGMKKHNQKKIYRIMRALDVLAVIRPKTRQKYTKSNPEQVADNILNREFNSLKPSEKWCCDITEFKLSNNGSKLYLCAIIDLYDNYIVGINISTRNDIALATGALKMALKANPNARPLVHTDRGSNFTSYAYKTILDQNNIIQSMSRAGKCIDNAPIEKFFGILKTEMLDYKNLLNLKELENAIIKHIDYYKTRRTQRRFHGRTPQQVRKQAMYQIKNNIDVTYYPIKENKLINAYWSMIASKNQNRTDHINI